jgi:hypothetical protein
VVVQKKSVTQKYFWRHRSDPPVAIAIMPPFAPQLDDSISESSFTICKNAKTLGSSVCFSNDDSVVQFDDTSVSPICRICRPLSVSFNDEANVSHEIERTVDDIQQDYLGYTFNEYDSIQFARDWLIVDSFAAGCFHESEQHTFRGLEYHDQDVIASATYAVLVEQYRQRERGMNRPDLLATVSILASHCAKKEARLRGKLYAAEVGSGKGLLDKKLSNSIEGLAELPEAASRAATAA